MVRVGLAGLLIGAVLLASIVIGNDGDPAVLLAIGEDAPSRDYTEDLVGRDVASRTSVGHDGRFFFAQAVDPLYLGDTANARYLDLELYRGQRMLFPLLVGLGGLTPPASIPWMMVVVHVLSYGLGTAATARLAQQQGGSPWWGLAFPFNIALFMSVLIGGAGVLTLACALAGTALLGDGRIKSAAAFLALSVLSREIMLLYCAGLVVHEWRRTSRFPIVITAVPILSFLTWYGYLLTRLAYESVFESNGALSAPFVGVVSAASTWADDAASIITAGISLSICLLLIRQFWRKPTPLLAGSIGFVVLAFLLSDLVWQNSFDISRALAPIYTTFVVATFAGADNDAASPSLA